jgi:GNAT superfamily N-acetyltransferase
MRLPLSEEHPGLSWYLIDQLRTAEDLLVFDNMYELYEASFPEASERQSKASWTEALSSRDIGYSLSFIVARDGYEVAGGIAFEYYPLSACGLLTFVFVRERYRKQKLGRALVERAHKQLRSGKPLHYVFAEVEDPERVDRSRIKSAIDPRLRLRILARLGARAIPIRYIQPALEPGQQPAEHLMLLILAPHEATSIDRSRLTTFLHEFYASLDVSEPDEAKLLVVAFAGLEGEKIPVFPLA